MLFNTCVIIAVLIGGPVDDKPLTFPAIVSWYGLSGSEMANGQIFDKDNKHLAAHKTLPLGTKVRLTNQNTSTKVSLVVEITDRGPFIKGRDFDVSESAARHLGFLDQGVVQLKVEILFRPASR